MRTKMIWGGALLTLVLVGAGCSGCGSKDTGDQAASTALSGGYRAGSLPNYSMQERAGKKVFTDNECLIYLDGENPVLSKNWQKNTNTEKIGNTTFNTTVYLENTHAVRMDAHALGSDLRLSLDNPAGFTRCVDDFRTFLGTVGK